MRTYTVVPSFEGNSAFFELPDIGFQGDHLSFAILFNLTELTEHWSDILPSMIVTNPKGETFISPYTSWDSEKHIFTWLISSTETLYEGYVKCQLRCTSADDPETIVCMSRICQTKVYQSLAAAENPPEAFQTWLDTLAQLGAEIREDASEIIGVVEAAETNALTAQRAAEAAEIAKNAAESARNTTESTARIAVAAQEVATQAQQRAQEATNTAETAKETVLQSKEEIYDALEDIDEDLTRAQTAASTAVDAAEQASSHMANANTSRLAAEAAKDAAVAAKTEAETAQSAAETAEVSAIVAKNETMALKAAAEDAKTDAEAAQTAAETAQTAAENAQTAAETAQAGAEAAQTAAETARTGVEDYADFARRFAEGKTYAGASVASTDPAYQNNAKYWAEQSEENALDMFNYLADVERRTVVLKVLTFTIRPSDWSSDGMAVYPIYADIEDESITSDQVPAIVLSEDSLEIAIDVGICTTIRSATQKVRIRAMRIPEQTVTGTLYLVGAKKTISLLVRSSDWVSGSFENYSYYADISDPDITSECAPLIVLDELSLKTASNCGLGTTARSYNGYIRIWSISSPEEDISGAIYLIGENDNSTPGGQQSTDLNIATDTDVQEMITDVFGS